MATVLRGNFLDVGRNELGPAPKQRFNRLFPIKARALFVVDVLLQILPVGRKHVAKGADALFWLRAPSFCGDALFLQKIREFQLGDRTRFRLEGFTPELAFHTRDGEEYAR